MASAKARGRFIVVEPSIRSVGGHYLQYALYVLRAAAELGFEPVLACHRDFPVEPVEGIQVVSVFANTFWGRWESAARPPTRLSRLCARALRLRSGLSHRFQVAWYFSGLYSFLGQILGPPFSKGFLGAALYKICRPFASLDTAIQKGMKKRTATGSRFVEATSEAISQFTTDLLQLHLQLSLRTGDHVLLATVSGAELTGVLGALRDDPALDAARWHLVFRRNIRPNPRINFSPEDAETRLIKRGLAWHRRCRPNVRLYTDTEALTEEYNTVWRHPVFRTLPIPHVRAREKPPEPAPYVVSYIGDARVEKGFPLLIPLVESVKASLLDTNKCRIRLQANFNTASGDPECVYARNQLRLYPDEQVELLTEPLSEEAYWKHIETSHVVLIPYDHNNYSQRSSGIFAECLGKEIPVIVPAGTWMSRQLQSHANQRLAELYGRGRIFDQSHLAAVPAPVTEGLVNPLESRWFIEWEEPKVIVATGCPKDAAQAIFRLNVHGRWQVRLQIDQRNADLALVLREDRLLEVTDPKTATQSYTLIELQQAAASLEIQVFGYRLMDLESHDAFGLSFVDRKDAEPFAGLGEIYFGADEIPALLERIVAHYDLYRAQLAAFGPEWRCLHSGAGFMKALNLETA
ncbi:MAG: hypothetical protein HYR64_05345 [Fimbriimonas ginsengisoli]|uniref:Uncharacterized protein n=1 Tax=Fimbriimonas ginsengisoli TaxID=1005039 RepID=A0A931LSH8_FIMGI|nr:hypothetical protein [Fimbriimonas ginsengisoli]